jgi:hypothetical protein
MRALKLIVDGAGIHIGVRRFAVINQVGAISLGARLDCHKFADVHSSSSHYDPKSFVGLAWRPSAETICSEIYSTGKSNLPGSRRQRQLLRSFSRMGPELLRHSSKPEKALLFAEHLRAAHRPKEQRVPRAKKKKVSLWDDTTTITSNSRSSAISFDIGDDTLDLGDEFGALFG